MMYYEIKKQIEICGMCNSEIELNAHQDGLVVNDEHFICTNCCINTDKSELMNFVKEKSQGFNNVRPIMRWLLERYKQKE